MEHLTREEFKTLLSDRRITDRQRLMFKVGFWHGLRVTELVSLTSRDIADGYVTVQRLKGSLKTHQKYQGHEDPLLDESRELTELANTLPAGERLFPMSASGVQKLMQRISRRTSLPRHKMHPHVLKHTIAMLTIKGAGIENVRQHLGHKSISSTGSYLKVSDDAASAAISGAAWA